MNLSGFSPSRWTGPAYSLFPPSDEAVAAVKIGDVSDKGTAAKTKTLERKAMTRYFLNEMLVLDERDSGLTIEAYEGEQPVLSGEDELCIAFVPSKSNPLDLQCQPV